MDAKTRGILDRLQADGRIQSWQEVTPDPDGCAECGHVVDDHDGTGPCPLDDCQSFTDPDTPEGGRFGMAEAALPESRPEDEDCDLSEMEWAAALEFGGFTANRSGWYDKGTARVIVGEGQVTVYRFDEHYVMDWKATLDVAVPQSAIDAVIRAALKEGPRR